MFRRSLSAPLFALVFALTGSSVATAQTPTFEYDIEGIEWNLVTYLDGETVELVPSDVRPTLFLDGFEASGSSGCNQFDAAYTSDTVTITFGDVVVGPTALCTAPAQAVEDAYVAALASTATWEIFESTLDLIDADGAIVLTFGRSPLDVTSDELLALTVIFARLQGEVDVLSGELAALRVPALRNRVSGLEGVIASVQEQVEGQQLLQLRTRIGGIELTLREYTERINGLRRRVQTLESRVEAIEAGSTPAPSASPSDG